MSELCELLVETANKIMKNYCTEEHLRELKEGEYLKELWTELDKTGITGVSISEKNGGSGGSFGDALNVLKVAGRYAAPIPLADTLLAKWILAESGLTFPSGPLSIVPPETYNSVRFVKQENSWRLSGVINGVPWARHAMGITVIGYVGDRLTVILLRPDDYSLNYGQNLAGEPLDDILLNNVEVSKEEVKSVSRNLDEKTILSMGALMRTALMSGALENILDLSIQYAQERVQFGRTISRFQAVQQLIARLADEVSAANTATNVAIAESEEELAIMETALAKVRVGQAVGDSVQIAHQVHGTIGFTMEHALHQFSRRLWVWRDEYGTETEWADLIGQQVVLQGSGSLWSFLTSSTTSKRNNETSILAGAKSL